MRRLPMLLVTVLFAVLCACSAAKEKPASTDSGIIPPSPSNTIVPSNTEAPPPSAQDLEDNTDFPKNGVAVSVEYWTEYGLTADNYVKINEGGKVTLADKDGNALISADDVIPFPFVFAVRESPDSGYRIHDKETLLPVSDEQWDEVICQRYPSDNLSTVIMEVRRGNYMGLIDPRGNTVLLPEKYELTDIRINTYEEVWPVISVKKGDLYGVICYDGEMIIEPVWKYLTMDVYNVPNIVIVFDGEKLGGIRLNGDRLDDGFFDGSWFQGGISAGSVDYSLEFPEWITVDRIKDEMNYWANEL